MEIVIRGITTRSVLIRTSLHFAGLGILVSPSEVSAMSRDFLTSSSEAISNETMVKQVMYNIIAMLALSKWR